MNFFNLILDHIKSQLQTTTLVEWLAFLFGVIQVILAVKNSILNFFAGIISVIFYVVLFVQSGLYAEGILNVYYFLISITGIITWQQKTSKDLPISKCNGKDWFNSIFISLVSFLVIYWVLSNYTNSTVPFLDSLASAFAWAGSWLLVKRKIENWLWLNLSNAIAIPLFYLKGLELTMLFTCVLFVVAVFGFLNWNDKIKRTF